MRKYFFSSTDFVQLFGEGGGAGAAGDGGSQGTAGTTPAGQESAALAQPQTQGVKSRNPLAEVQYGLPAEEDGAPDAGEQKQTAAPEQPVDRAAQFETLIKGEYKDLFEQRMRDTIQKRLKGNEEKVKRYDAMSPVLELMAKSYGVDPKDTDALRNAIEKDDKFFEDAAMENGTTTAQERQKWRMAMENQQLREQVTQVREAAEQQRKDEQAVRQVDAWRREGEALKQIYPSFDLRKEAQNEQFRAMLSSGVSVRTAFEVMHKDEMLAGAMQFASKQAEEKVANAVQAGKRRPAEGAMASRAPSLRKTDVTQLTRADREEIDRRVARGEKIRF